MLLFASSVTEYSDHIHQGVPSLMGRGCKEASIQGVLPGSPCPAGLLGAVVKPPGEPLVHHQRCTTSAVINASRVATARHRLRAGVGAPLLLLDSR